MKSFIKIIVLGSMFFGLSVGAITQEDRQILRAAMDRYHAMLTDVYFTVYKFKEEKNDRSGCYDVARFEMHLKNELPEMSKLPEDVRYDVSSAVQNAKDEIVIATEFCRSSGGKRTAAYRAVRRAIWEIENVFYLLDQKVRGNKTSKHFKR